jgi:hypothetical protein
MLLSLPREIIDKILDETFTEGSVTQESFVLTTICKTLAPSVVRALYREVEIRGGKQLEHFLENVPLSTRTAIRSLRLFIATADEESGKERGRVASHLISTMPNLSKLHLGPLANSTIETLIRSGSLASLRNISVVHPLLAFFRNTPEAKRDLLNACPRAEKLSLHGPILHDSSSWCYAMRPFSDTHPRLLHLELSMLFNFPASMFAGLQLQSLTLGYMSGDSFEKIAAVVGPSLRHLRLSEP